MIEMFMIAVCTIVTSPGWERASSCQIADIEGTFASAEQCKQRAGLLNRTSDLKSPNGYNELRCVSKPVETWKEVE